jgi:hypothetical protein
MRAAASLGWSALHVEGDVVSQGRPIWKPGEVLAFTEREGPGRPPAASPTWMIATLVVVVGVTFAGMVSTDTLCPDHRVWVQALASTGFITIVVAFIGLLRGWAGAPILTVFASSLGIAIGLLETVHDATRGRLIILGFAVGCALAAAATLRVVRLRAWDRATAAAVGPIVGDDEVVAPAVRAPRPADAQDADSSPAPIET